MRVRFLTFGLLVLGGLLCDPSPVLGRLAVAAAPTAVAGLEVVRQQQPVSTIPPLFQPPFSTIPPLATTPPAPTPTSIPIPTPLATRVVPPIPTPITVRPAVPPPAPAQAAPNAGGFPTDLALLVFGLSATTLGAGVFMMRRARLR